MTTTVEQIKSNPHLHLHKDTDELMQCCRSGKAIDASLVEAHGKYVDLGTNAGARCDVLTGPCACGAWHDKKEPRFLELQLRNKFQQFLAVAKPEISTALRKEFSMMATKMVYEYLKAKPKDRKRILKERDKKICAWLKKITKTA